MEICCVDLTLQLLQFFPWCLGRYPKYDIACCFFLQDITHPLRDAEKTIPYLSHRWGREVFLTSAWAV